MGDWNRKAKLFKRWLIQNQNASVALEPFARRIPNKKKLIAALKEFEAMGYSLDERGVPVGFDEGNEEVVLALREAFEKVLGHPATGWHHISPELEELYTSPEEELFEEWRWYLDRLRGWLIYVSKSAKEPRWWQTIPWDDVKYEVLGMIMDSLPDEVLNVILVSPLVEEEGVPVCYEGEDPEGFWRTIEESILTALINHALEIYEEA